MSLLATLLGTTAYALPSAARPPFRYGIVVSNTQNYPEVAKLGFGYVKLFVGWNGLEPSPGNIGNYPDFAVQQAHANNLHIVALIFDTPAWATCSGTYNPNSPPPCANNPNHLPDFGKFMGTLAAHYKGQIDAYEIWNEPNVNDTWGNQNPDVGTYVSMLQAAYPQIKSGDPNALVISGGLSNTGNGNPPAAIGDLTYLQQMLAMGAANDLDAIGIHPYPGACDPTATSCNQTPGTYFQRANEEHNTVVQAGFPNIPLWITEAGYFSQPGAIDPNAAGCNGSNGLGGFTAYEVDETTKATWLVQAYQYAYNNWPWLGMFMMMNLDLSMDGFRATCDPVRFWSILTSSGSETQAYTALMNMTKMTPQINLPPVSSLQQLAGTFTLNVSVSDPTTSGTTVDEVIVSIGAPYGQTNALASVTVNPDGTFNASFDTSHLTYNQTTLVYVYAHTPSSGWIYGSAGVVPAPQATVSMNALYFSITPSQPRTSSITVDVNRNDQNNQAFTWTVTPSSFGGWLTVKSTNNGALASAMNFVVTVNATSLSPGTYQTTLTFDGDANSKAWLKNMPFTIPVTVVIGPKATLNYQIYLPLDSLGASLNGLPGH